MDIYKIYITKKKCIVTWIIIGVLPLASLYYWYNNSHNNARIALANTWQSVNSGISRFANQSQLDAAQKFSNENNNHYGVLIALGLARQFTNRNNFITAEEQLTKALGKTHDANLQSLINIQLARIQLQENDTDRALKTLDRVNEQGWGAITEMIRGNAQVIKGDYQAARASYKKALRIGAPPELLRIKLNNLS